MRDWVKGNQSGNCLRDLYYNCMSWMALLVPGLGV